MKKYFIDFLKAFCAYDEFTEAFNASQMFFDFDYYLKFTDPSFYIMGAFCCENDPFSTTEKRELYNAWRKRLTQINKS